MILYVLSDIHLEHHPFNLDKDAIKLCDAIILAGDITGEPAKLPKWLKANGVPQNKPVLYIYGNHEWYGREMFITGSAIDKPVFNYARGISGSGMLKLFDENENHFIMGDTMFVATTLWTDLKGIGISDEQSKYIASRYMNDYTWIKYDKSRYLTPDDTQALHYKMKEGIYKAFNGWKGKRVVITHHMPSYQGVALQFRNNVANHCFTSALDDMIHELEIDMWISGHTHTSYDYTIGKCRMICNPRGYCSANRSENPNFNPRLLIEI